MQKKRMPFFFFLQDLAPINPCIGIRGEAPLYHSSVYWRQKIHMHCCRHPGQGRGPSEEHGGAENEDNMVTYIDEGFSPTILRVKKGESVTLKNMDTSSLWVASNPHSTHIALPSFDAGRTLINRETYMYTFTQIGSWSYYNHLNARFQGTIVVE